jgi:hypothetical protein
MPARSKFCMKATFSVNPWVFIVYSHLEIPFNCGFLLMVERTKGSIFGEEITEKSQ